MAAAAMHNLASKALFEDQTRRLEGDILNARKWRLFSRDFPVLDIVFEQPEREPFRVLMDCADWNELPPWVSLLTIDGEALKTAPTGPTGIFNQGPHPITKRIFVCMAGTREYHTHPSHTNDIWDNYKQRSGYDLGGILTRIWSGWMKSKP